MGVAGTARAGCNGEATPLHALSALSGHERVDVRGVVIAVFPGLKGFFLEAAHADWDTNPKTSEAVFVYRGRHPLHLDVGTRIAFNARYQLFHGVPELSRVRALSRCGQAQLPPTVDLSLPLAAGTWTARRGMRVRISQALTVGDLGDFVRYGEVRVSADGRHFAPTAQTVPGPGAASLERVESSRLLWLDDGSSQAHPLHLRLGTVRFDAQHPLRSGQMLHTVTGIAYRAFGRNLLEVTALDVDAGANPRRTVAELHLPTGLRVVSFNVENYFNRALTGSPFPTERGARSATHFRCQTQKLVAAFAQLRPVVAGVQEIENNGYGNGGALATLVGALNHRITDAAYHFIRPPHREHLGTDLIAPALLYDAQHVMPQGRVAVLSAPASNHALYEGLPRPALAASFKRKDNGAVFTVVVVHLRSKRSRCGGGLDSHAGAGHCALARTQASRYLAHWVASRPTGVRSDAVVLLGDFNAYPHESAMRVLQRAGWRTEPPLNAQHPAYSESGSWGAGRLDYILVSPALATAVRGAAIWHSDADEAPGFGYAGRPACTGTAAPYRASDHDPVVAVLGQ
ncbi:MAG: ExeM/NucH family extracellular endonuclease [Gammaproteobacteria bacterium]